MAMMSMMALTIGILGSVFNTYASLYQAKDNDLMLSLPIPVRAILFARLSGVYIMGAMFAVTAMVPGIIVYGIVAHPGVWPVVSSIIVLVLLTFVILVLSCILGWVVGKIGNKTRNKSFVTVVLSLAFNSRILCCIHEANKLLSKILANSRRIQCKDKRCCISALFNCPCGYRRWLQLAFVQQAH